MDNDNIVDFEKRIGIASRGETGKQHEIARRCQGVLLDLLRPLIRELFEHTDDDMYALANKSSEDIVGTQYFAAMRQLRKLQDGIEQTFQDYLKRIFREFWAANDIVVAEGGKLEPNSIALVEEDELEEQLAVDAMIKKAENRFGLELHGISARFAKIAGTEHIESSQNPLSPYHFTEAFRLSLRAWEGDIGLRLVVLKLFDRHVMTYLGGVYDAINDILIDEGVLPKLKRSIKKNPVAPYILRSKGQGQPGGELSQETREEIGARSHETFDLIGMMLAQRHESLGYQPYSGYLPRPHGYEAFPEVSNQEFAEALTSVQALISDAPPVGVTDVRKKNLEYLAHLSSLLALSADQQSAKRLAEYDQMLIDAVGMLFDFVLDDKEVPDQVKALIARLQFPMIKLAKLDFSFFGNKEHPARRLLNNMGHAAFGWSEGSDRFSRLLYEKIETAVSRVIGEFIDDVDVFRDINEEFEDFLSHQAEFARKSEDRVTQIVRGQEELLKARRRAATVIDEYNSKVDKLPEPILAFQREAWHDVMMLTWLREGEDSERWGRHVDALRLLIWSGLPKNGADQRQKLLKTIPVLLKRLHEGLQEIGFDMNRAGELFNGLKSCHRAILTGKEDLPWVPVSVSGTDGHADPSANMDDRGATDLGNLPELGEWLKWEEDGVTYRGKLAWMSSITGVCIFVNRDGMKIAEMSSDKLSGLIGAGNAKTMPAQRMPLLDEMLETMQKALGR